MLLEFPDRLKQLADAGLNLVYPSACQICGTERSKREEGYVCADCWTEVRFIQEPFCKRCGLPYDGEITTAFECTNCREMKLHFRSARSAVVASGVVLDVLHRYKYKRALWFEPFLADLLVRRAQPDFSSRKMGFHCAGSASSGEKTRTRIQPGRTSRHLTLSRHWRSHGHHLVERAKFAHRNAFTKTRDKAPQNVQGAFPCEDASGSTGNKILIFDDVLTTGATTNACAAVLRAAGAGEICVWTVARGFMNAAHYKN